MGFLVPGGARSGARAIARFRIEILVSGRGFGYQSSTPLVPPRITYLERLNIWYEQYVAWSAYISTSSRDDVGRLLAIDGPTKFHPWGSDQNRLSTNGVYAFVFYPSQEAGSYPSAHYECVGFERGESAFHDLRYMLE